MFLKIRKPVSILVIIAFVLFPQAGFAADLPVLDGSPLVNVSSVTDDGTTFTVNQSANQAIINYTEFDVAAGKTVHFNQDPSWIALNRVTGNTTSDIFGTITAAGTIYLINPNGILFGAGSQIDVGSMIASTYNITNDEFNAGTYSFPVGATTGSLITNNGSLLASGDVNLWASSIMNNTGIIEGRSIELAANGDITICSGSKITASGTGDVDIDVIAKNNINIDSSTLTATGSDTADAEIYLANTESGNIMIASSTLTSTAVAGESGVYIANDETDIDSDTEDIFDDIEAENWGKLVEDLIESKPINGTVTINNSTLTATSSMVSSGEYDFGDAAATIGILANDIAISGSQISANNLYDVAAVGMLAMNDMSMTGGAIRADSEAVSVVALASLGLGEGSGDGNIISSGTITADGGDNGFGIVGLMAMNNITVSGAVTAAGGGDVIGLLEDLVEEETGESFDLGIDETYGSGVLMATLRGHITVGDVTGDVVALSAVNLDGLADDFESMLEDLGIDLENLDEVDLESVDLSGLNIDEIFDSIKDLTGGGSIISGYGTINAKALAMLASDNISVSTNVDDLIAISTDGNVIISEVDGINLIDVEALGSTINVTTNGDTYVGNMLAEGADGDSAYIHVYVYNGGLNVVDGNIKAINSGNGTSYVYLYAPVSIDVLNSTVSSQSRTGGSAYTYLYSPEVSIKDSSVLATVGDPVNGTSVSTGYAVVNITNYYNNSVGDVLTVDNSLIKSHVFGGNYYNDTSAYTFLGYNWNSGNYYSFDTINILSGSTVASEVGGGQARTYAYAGDYYSYNNSNSDTFAVNVTDSTVSSLTGNGYAYTQLYAQAYNDTYYGMSGISANNNTSVNLNNSFITSEVTDASNDNYYDYAETYVGAYNQNQSRDYYTGGYDILSGADVAAVTAVNSTVSSKISDSQGGGQYYGQAYTQIYAQNYNYVEDYYADSGAYRTATATVSLDNTDVFATELGSSESGNGYASTYVGAYSRDYQYNNTYNRYWDTVIDQTASVNILNGSSVSATSEQGNAQIGIYAETQSYDYNNYENDDTSSILIEDSSVLSGSVLGSAEMYIRSRSYEYDYNWGYYDEDGNASLVLVNSDITSFVADGDIDSSVDVESDGSILADAASLISANWVNFYARNNIGTVESPINTNTRNLSAYSWGEPEWVSVESEPEPEPEPEVEPEPAMAERVLFLEEDNGYYLYGTGGIYVNNIGDDLLNVGLGNNQQCRSSEGGEGDSVQTNNGMVSVTTQGDMVVHNVNAEMGGVFLKSENGSMYAGLSRYGEGGPNVIADGYSYFSTPNGTIGVGTPDSKDPAISGQIAGYVDPATTAVTGLNPSIDLDLTQGVPPGGVFYLENMQPRQEQKIVEIEGEGQELPEPSPQQVWPAAPVVDPGAFENPLRVYIEVLPGAIPAVPVGFIPLAGLTLQIGSPALDTMPNWLFNDFKAYYELLRGYRVASFEPATPTSFYGYHPLTPADASAFDEIALDEGAYDFIDGTLNMKKKSKYLGEAGEESEVK